jgi:hypothetical protein
MPVIPAMWETDDDCLMPASGKKKLEIVFEE